MISWEHVSFSHFRELEVRVWRDHARLHLAVDGEVRDGDDDANASS